MVESGKKSSLTEKIAHFIHHYLIWLLLGSYAIAAVIPGMGLWIKSVPMGKVSLFQNSTPISLPMVLLSYLLFNAGLGVPIHQIGEVIRKPISLIAGLSANLFVPISFIFLISFLMKLWHDSDEVQNILVGLALIASMPIAGSSTAWSQNTNGNLALSLGLVLFSTLLSPVTTPIALHSVGWLADGDYAEDLHELAAGGTTGFLVFSVILPSLAGIGSHYLLGEKRVTALKPVLKIFNYAVLLLLNYSNASVSLPQAFKQPDLDFLALIGLIVFSLCVISFSMGWIISNWLAVDRQQRVSLMFGLGMNNNGTGLVLATMALEDHPNVLLPIIFYNLVQHFVAGLAVIVLSRSKIDQES